jgi:signal transduction histidine kinase
MGPASTRFGRGKVLAKNWSIDTRVGPTSGPLVAGGARSVSLGVSDDTWPKRRTSLILLAVGGCAFALPIILHAGVYQAPTLRAAVETMMMMCGFASAWLLRGQFASSRRLTDLVLFGGALTVGLTALCFGAVPVALDLHESTHFAAAELLSQLLVGAALAAAARTRSDRLVVGSRNPVMLVAVLSVASVVGAALGGLLFHAQLVGGRSHGVDASVQGGSHPLGLVIVLSATGLFALAATGFGRRHQLGCNGVAGLLAVAALMLGAAGFSQLILGSVASRQIGPDQALMALGFALILVAAVQKDRQGRAQMAKAAALAERRRVARDLHDGLAQDLAVIATQGEFMARDIGPEHPIVIAARRALALSRSAIAELSDLPGATADETLEAVAEEFRDRCDVAIAVDADCDGELAPEAQEQVSRIAREAIANAARHGSAKHVVVSLRGAENGITLRVVDDGCGIVSGDVAGATEGFGLRSMRERTDALGGCLTLRRLRRGGTELEVILP